jgi:hypothetical protein
VLRHLREGRQNHCVFRQQTSLPDGGFLQFRDSRRILRAQPVTQCRCDRAGNGYECGIYLDVRSGSAGGIIDGVSITHIPAKPLGEANTTFDSDNPKGLSDRSASGSDGKIAWCRGRLERWDLGAVRVNVLYRFDVAAPDGSVEFEVGGRSFEDGDPWCDNVGAKQTCTGTLQDLGDLCQTAASAALILAGKPTVTHLQQTFQISRHAGAGGGAGDARVQGLLIEYTEALAQEPAW